MKNSQPQRHHPTNVPARSNIHGDAQYLEQQLGVRTPLFGSLIIVTGKLQISVRDDWALFDKGSSRGAMMATLEGTCGRLTLVLCAPAPSRAVFSNSVPSFPLRPSVQLDFQLLTTLIRP